MTGPATPAQHFIVKNCSLAATTTGSGPALYRSFARSWLLLTNHASTIIFGADA